MTNLTNAKEIDLHELRLYDAEVVICESIEEAWVAGENALRLIHGYHNGVAIKSFIRRRNGLRGKWARDYRDMPDIEVMPRDHGSTYVILGEE